MWKYIAIAEASLFVFAWVVYYIVWCDTIANTSSLRRRHPAWSKIWTTTIAIGIVLAVATIVSACITSACSILQ